MPSSSRSLSDASHDEVLRAFDDYVATQLPLLLPVDKCWQPSDLLPDLTAADWHDQLVTLRQGAAALPDDVLVTLVANMITEEALPSYHAWLVNLQPGFDRSGTSQGGTAQWIRNWVAEEARHGESLTRYLYASGRVNLRSVEVTLQNLLRNGFDPQTDNDIFKAFIYTAFQERATMVAHSGVAAQARKHGDACLARICDMIAGDEARHGRAYERFVTHLFTLDTDQTMLALDAMMRRTIVMPSRTMTDGSDPDLFGLFSAVTQRNGIYTTSDYARIMDQLIRLWKVETQPVRSDAAKAAQDYLGRLPSRYLRLAERAEGRLAQIPDRPISWIFGRTMTATSA